MKRMIIAAITVGAGAVLLLLSRLSVRRTRKPMTFAELYEDNRCDEIGSLFD